jgi:hypothetical protein
VGVTAKNIVRPTQFRVENRALGNFIGEAQPSFAFSFQKVTDPFIFEIKKLNKIVYLARQNTKKGVVYEKVVKLMAMDGKVLSVSVLPSINFIKAGSGKGGKNIRKSFVMVSFHPSHFCRFGQLADDRNQFPVVSAQAIEIEIFKDISQKNQFLELETAKKIRRFL